MPSGRVCGSGGAVILDMAVDGKQRNKTYIQTSPRHVSALRSRSIFLSVTDWLAGMKNTRYSQSIPLAMYIHAS